ncbi:hypothetical protein BCR34DRAFT_317886 [Clohesyomyces aquaticus]|uniref:Uncharacterized protein n=1 Tax=Clohesyomyces aquaticus TaxID=1231657 RepID=A0A1Y1ZN06_9PLEO|nr:hypothetical protein BCR34DRAFT_317886 [Clohesyomyces aquaticus]
MPLPVVCRRRLCRVWCAVVRYSTCESAWPSTPCNPSNLNEERYRWERQQGRAELPGLGASRLQIAVSHAAAVRPGPPTAVSLYIERYTYPYTCPYLQKNLDRRPQAAARRASARRAVGFSQAPRCGMQQLRAHLGGASWHACARWTSVSVSSCCHSHGYQRKRHLTSVFDRAAHGLCHRPL